MKQYLDLVRKILVVGVYKEDRTGTGTFSIFGEQMRFDLSKGFPLVTAKHTHIKPIIHELLWFLKGDTNIRYLKENGVKIWDDWADKNGDLGPVYGAQWRSWPVTAEATIDALIELACLGHGDTWGNSDGNMIARKALLSIPGIVYNKKVFMSSGFSYSTWMSVANTGKGVYDEKGNIDQISNLIHMLRTNPDSRRLIVSAWNPVLVESMALPPCHSFFQFYSEELSYYSRWKTAERLGHCMDEHRGKDHRDVIKIMDSLGVPSRKLSCKLTQRSADSFLGVPYNIASYSLLTMMVAQVTNHTPGEFIWSGGDCHIYSNHVNQVDELLTRETHDLPTMTLNPNVRDIFDFKYEDFTLSNYKSNPHIPAPIAV